MYTGVTHPYLDAIINCDKIAFALEKCKYGKAPGSNGIAFEFIKNLTQNRMACIEKLFSHIMDQETIPIEWDTIHASMIHTKGGKNKPNNYRIIALVNRITKMFTHILTNRLQN